MRILLVGLYSDGHRKQYLEYIAEAVEQQNNQAILLCPEACVNDFNVPNKRAMKIKFAEKRTLKRYFEFLSQIRRVASEEHVDIIHFLEADEIYRYFGLGLRKLSRFPVIMTFHHLYTDNWRNSAIKAIMNSISGSVVHTEVLAKHYASLVKNSQVKHIEYPVFDYDKLQEILPTAAKKEFELPLDKKIVGLLGGTMRYKGYHFLLENLKDLRGEGYHFFFAGIERYYTHKQIKEALDRNNIEGTIVLRELTSYEFCCAVQASDIILLPYGKEFNGASGLLAEGVCAGKTIIGSDYGSLGALIRENHIGYTFEVENGRDLIQVLNQAKKKEYKYDQVAMKYQNYLQPQLFGEAYLQMYYQLKE
jgi:glycosyltransferase involved in cell wall biosynthesis